MKRYARTIQSVFSAVWSITPRRCFWLPYLRDWLRRPVGDSVLRPAFGPHQQALHLQRCGGGDPVITYVARNLEPYRGFHQFMRALPAIQREHKTAHTVIVGGDDVSYGRKPEGAKHWREKMLQEVGSQLDPTRTQFLGKVPYEGYKRILQVSAAHVYLTYAFVLSWSMLEAMATGCLVVGSDTAPVLEALEDGVNGRLVKAFDQIAIANAALEALATPVSSALRVGAMKTAVERYSLRLGVKSFNQICLEGALPFGIRQAA